MRNLSCDFFEAIKYCEICLLAVKTTRGFRYGRPSLIPKGPTCFLNRHFRVLERPSCIFKMPSCILKRPFTMH